MWGGEINDEQIYRSQEEDTNLSLYMGSVNHGNNLQQFNTSDFFNSFPNAVRPGEVENDALFTPELMQRSSFNIVRPQTQEFCRDVMSRDQPEIEYDAILSHQENNANINVDEEAMFRSITTGLPYENVEMVNSYGESEAFW
jgi:hypothetical protein